jgi:para-nitrobenzyl esterase
MYETNFAPPQPLVMSEDCLYLDVWTPDPSAGGLPVLLWVPGGGFRTGWGSQSMYDGTHLAAQGLIVVSISYRLGALGYLAHPALSAESSSGTSGNYGVTDVLRALVWVQENIAAFGGDPARVTLAGNSAGAIQVNHLMTAPAAQGLFARVVGQSGGAFPTPRRPVTTLADAEKAGLEFALARKAEDAETLRALSGAELILGGAAAPIIDGWILPEESRAAFESGRQAPVPLLLGWNSDEASPYPSAESLPAPALSLYPPEDAQLSARAYLGDVGWRWPVWKWASVHTRTAGQPVWLYEFDQSPPLPPNVAPPPDGLPGYGAYHTAELLYAWNALHTRPWNWTATDRQLASTMSAAWARFVIDGDPGLPEWTPLLSGDEGHLLRFGAQTRAMAVPRLDRLALQDHMIGAEEPHAR